MQRSEDEIRKAIQDENRFSDELVSVLRSYGECELKYLSAQFLYHSEPQSPDIAFLYESQESAPNLIFIEIDFCNRVCQSAEFLREKQLFVAEGSEVPLINYVLVAPLRDNAADRSIVQGHGITVVSHKRVGDLVDLVLELAGLAR